MNYIFTEQESKWLEEANAARSRNDFETFKKYVRLVPIHPVSAKAIKRQFGAEYLINEGFNLKWANLEFGEGWLDK